jgi:transcriptional regulator with XRE-family HTH domain
LPALLLIPNQDSVKDMRAVFSGHSILENGYVDLLKFCENKKFNIDKKSIDKVNLSVIDDTYQAVNHNHYGLNHWGWPVMPLLGKKIREERRKRHLTLQQLSQRTGLSKGFLSQIERNLTNPSITSLKKIAFEFGISVVNFFTDEENGAGYWGFAGPARIRAKHDTAYVSDVQVVRSDRRKRLALPGSNVVYELLTPDLNRQIEVMYLRFSKEENSGDEPMVDPPGEKFGFVLKGSLEMKVGGEVHQLQAGDCIYFPAHFPHSWCSLANGEIEVIWVLTPPSF